MNISALALPLGQEMKFYRQNFNFSDNSQRTDHLRTQKTIAEKWVKTGCFNAPDSAIRAFIGGAR